MRSQSGSMLAVTIASIFLVIGCGLVVIFLLFMVGLNVKTQNTIDAAALNVAQAALKCGIKLDDSQAQRFYLDVSDRGEINLSNINRVWAKALLVGLNCQKAADEQEAKAIAARATAEELSNKLAAKLKDKENLKGYFTEICVQRSSNIQPAKSGWASSSTGAGSKSNIKIDEKQLPSERQMLEAPISKEDNESRFKGYMPARGDFGNYWFVPFDSTTHLVSASTIGKADTTSWKNPIPNVFSVQGETISQSGKLAGAMAYASPGSNTVYRLQMPHSYVVLKIENKIYWYNSLKDNYVIDFGKYEFAREERPSRWLDIKDTVRRARITAGQEYNDQSLLSAVMGKTTNSQAAARVMSALLQRIDEICPDYKMGDLTQLLKSTQLKYGCSDYVLHMDDKTKTIKCEPASQAILAPESSLADAKLDAGNFEYGTVPGNVDIDLGKIDIKLTHTNYNTNINTHTNYELIKSTGQVVTTTSSSTQTSTSTSTIIDTQSQQERPQLRLCYQWSPKTGYPGGCLGIATVCHELRASLLPVIEKTNTTTQTQTYTNTTSRSGF